jgi:error-prone DNA polymerase
MRMLYGTPSLFEEEQVAYEIPALQAGPYDQAFDEIELLGFPLCSPFDLLVATPLHTIPARMMVAHTGRRVQMLGYFVARKHVTTVRREHMNFGTWLDREGLFFDSTHFPQSLAGYPFRGRGIYLMEGRIVLDVGFPMLEVDRMDKQATVSDDRY